MTDLVSLGFRWVRPHMMPPEADRTGRYQDLLSVSEHWSRSLPGYWTFSWASDPAERLHLARALGVADLDGLFALSDAKLEAKEIGFPNVCFTRATAEAFRERAKPDANLRLLELGLPAELRAEALEESRPVGTWSAGGIHLALTRNVPVGPGRLLGYELVTLDVGTTPCSYACNDLGPGLENGGVVFNDLGLIEDAGVAIGHARALSAGAFSAEPSLWLPIALIEPE